MSENPMQPFFILVRPQMGENIGAAARGMWNFGLDKMRVVSPRDGWPSQKAVAMASGAGRLLDEAVQHSSVSSAVSESHFTFATTARARGLTKEIYSPNVAMSLAAQRIQAGERVSVLFGPERAGLENEDVAQANALISVPVNPQFASLNLAQCVLLMAYEWRRASTDVQVHRMEMVKTDWATGQEVEILSQHYEERLDEVGFFFPEQKAAGMKINLRNMWSRLSLTRADVQTFHGMVRQIARWKDGGC
jgi:tRNA/rRNA methyltransferase